LYVCELFISTAVSLSVCELFQFPAVTCPVTLQKRYHGVLSGKLIDLMEVCIMSLSVWQTCVYDQMSWTRCTVKVVLTWTHCLLNHTFGHPDWSTFWQLIYCLFMKLSMFLVQIYIFS